MTNSYLFSLFIFILLQLNMASISFWQSLSFLNNATIFLVIVSILTFILLVGFTHVIKANNNAKFHSYLCATLCMMFSLLYASIIFTTANQHLIIIILLVVCFICGFNLALKTYKKTKSYFL